MGFQIRVQGEPSKFGTILFNFVQVWFVAENVAPGRNSRLVLGTICIENNEFGLKMKNTQ